MIKRFVISVLFVTFSVIGSSAQSWEWVSSGENSTTETVSSVTTDASGNIYIVGSFSGSINLGTHSISSTGGTDVFFAKLAPSGSFLWAKSIGGASSDVGNDIAIDNFGNIFVTGKISDACFLQKRTKNGTVVWTKYETGAGTSYGTGVSCDANGNPIVSGDYYGSVQFGSTSLSSVGQTDIFLVKYDSTGNEMFVKKAAGNSWDESDDLTVDVAGNIYIAGYFVHTIDFSGTVLNTSDNSFGDVFVAKYNSSGVLVWAKQYSSSYGEGAHGIETDAIGNVYITGHYYKPLTFGSTVLTGNGGYEVFIAKLDVNGDAVWAKSLGGSGFDWANSIDIDNSGDIITVGTFSGSATIQSSTLVSNGGKDLFVVKHKPDGTLSETYTVGGLYGEEALKVKIASDNSIFVVGYFNQGGSAGNIVPFGTINLVAGGSADMFVGKIGAPAIPTPTPPLSKILLHLRKL